MGGTQVLFVAAVLEKRGILQPGNEVHASWRARLEEHLGTFTVELLDGHAARVLTDPGRLAAMSSACSLVDICLPEREPHPDLFASLQAMFSILPEAEWAAAYVAWELSLLAELGFGLDLSACAATSCGRFDLCIAQERPRLPGISRCRCRLPRKTSPAAAVLDRPGRCRRKRGL